MSKAQLRELAFAKDFKPMRLEFVSGRTVDVPHPDYLIFPPTSDLVFLFVEPAGLYSFSPESIALVQSLQEPEKIG